MADGRPGPADLPDDAPADELRRLRERVAALERTRPPAERHHRVRAFFSALLIVVGCVLAPLSVVAAWASQEVGDTDRYVATVAPIAANADVQNAVANRVTDAVMAHIDLNTLLEGVAPADRPRVAQALGKLGGALENAVRSFVHDKSREVVASDRFQTFWVNANRKIHSAVDKALTGSGGGAVQLTDNAVQIDLAPVIDQVKARLVADGLTVADKIPEVHTQFTVVKSDDIGKLKTGFRLLQLAGFWLPVLALVLVAAGILLAVRRRRALAAAALGVAFATLLLGLGLTVFRAVYLDALPASASQPAAGAVYDALVRLMRTTIRMVVALGIVIALGAWLTGRGRRAVLVRRLWHSGIRSVRTTADHAGMRTGPVGPWIHRYRCWIVWVLVALAVLSYLLWSYPTAWVVVGIVLVLLLALAIVDFLAEAPEETEDAGHITRTGVPE
ncbi:hypothetical protein [Streptomyces sp. NPDC058953]|uniref:hypothetical protein n=1 Tax=unclassified Streptomyces TaxID=2593676 RepID=UPI003694BEAE